MKPFEVLGPLTKPAEQQPEAYVYGKVQGQIAITSCLDAADNKTDEDQWLAMFGCLSNLAVAFHQEFGEKGAEDMFRASQVVATSYLGGLKDGGDNQP